MRLTVVAVIALSLALPASLYPSENQNAVLVLTPHLNGTVPQSEFSCHGTIHGYLRLPERTQGKHRLEGYWERPNGDVVRSQTDVEFPPPGRSTAYLWFSFPDTSAIFSVNPKADEERLSYAGPWTVRVRWDGDPILQSTFTVRCP